MGAPPKEMLQNSEYAMKFFDGEGKVKLFFFLYRIDTTDG